MEEKDREIVEKLLENLEKMERLHDEAIHNINLQLKAWDQRRRNVKKAIDATWRFKNGKLSKKAYGSIVRGINISGSKVVIEK